MSKRKRFSSWVPVLVLSLLFVGAVAGARAWRERAAGSEVERPLGQQAAVYLSPTLPAPTATRLTSAERIPATYTAAPAGATPRQVPTTQARPTWTAAPTATRPPATARPTATATARIYATLALPPQGAVPTAVRPFAKPEGVTNILLLGNDAPGRQGGRTDSITIVSINHEMETATMLSLPRDLYVVIPGWKIARINQALPHGHGTDYPGGGGALVKDTILYNFGLPIDYYVRLGFDGFKQVVDALGGVEVVVSCPLEDWQLIEPHLDPDVEGNWAWFELGSGVYHMDGDLALWYARSRMTTNDFERGQRQQQLLSALLERGLDLDLLTQVPALWQAYRDTVETDLTLAAVIRLARLAPAVRDNGIQHLYLPTGARRSWTTEGGASVQLLQWEGAAPVFSQLMQPPLLKRAQREPIVVEVATESETMYRLAADNLAYHGFLPTRAVPTGASPQHTEIQYSGRHFKGSFNWLLAWILNVPSEEIELSQERAASQYRVLLGRDYDPCRPQLEAPNLGNEH